jgi:cytochrome oxidase Cu insertion factor (SCO1/SenC/PrrC family)
MTRLTKSLLVLCCGLLLALPGYAQVAATAGAATTDSVANRDSAVAEEKARRFFTDLEVIDQNGERLRFYSDVLKDRVVLISFIFTNCEGACPMVAQKLKQTRSMMVDAIKDDVWFVSISIDPERDTPEAMKKFAENQGVDESRWIFLTGEKQNLETIIKKLGQYTPDIEAHSTLMLAGNTRTRHWTRVMPMVPPEGIAQQMRALVEETPG